MMYHMITVNLVWYRVKPALSNLLSILMLNIVFFLQVSNLKSALEGVEKERDYYFGKLREVEMLCQEHAGENATFVDQLLEVLYSSYDQVSL